MFVKFEEIIKDHRRRNRQTILVALGAFFILFLLFNVGFAFWIFQSGPRSKVDALLSWNPTTSQYVFSLIGLLMLFWWVWLFLSYKLLQMRASLISDHMIEDYRGRQMKINKPSAWEDFERASFFSKQVGSKILIAMTGALVLSTFLSWGSRSLPIILSAGLLVYEFAALTKAKKIAAFLHGIFQAYTAEGVPANRRTNQLQQYIFFGLFCGVLFTISADRLIHLNIFNLIFFFLAFSGLSVASALLRGISKFFTEVVQVADSVRFGNL